MKRPLEIVREQGFKSKPTSVYDCDNDDDDDVMIINKTTESGYGYERGSTEMVLEFIDSIAENLPFELPTDLAYNSSRLPINVKKMEDLKKILQYIPDGMEGFYTELYTWPTSNKDRLEEALLSSFDAILLVLHIFPLDDRNNKLEFLMRREQVTYQGDNERVELLYLKIDGGIAGTDAFPPVVEAQVGMSRLDETSSLEYRQPVFCFETLGIVNVTGDLGALLSDDAYEDDRLKRCSRQEQFGCGACSDLSCNASVILTWIYFRVTFHIKSRSSLRAPVTHLAYTKSFLNRVLVGRPEGKRPLGRPRRRWEDNIKMDLREVGYDDRDWINLAQDRDRWRAYVRAAMNLRVP
ncbi:hypothetical protein ANN_13797 [Periplaneta americana]|uniref:Uncharacterized protein n=1 Tax=Periplaneta americana TaxID=6978 RepID=A0ABQ8SV34_PERAM|nr:hypothetical protein ANN_13797 [Periplaneta americana]